jgi:uncharacterized protein GlcG (DUF336 family)
MGVRLVNRTARSASLTEPGLRYSEFANRILDEIDDATEGGDTVKRDAEILGGLGVAGGTGDEDQQIADSVLAALGYQWEFQAWGVPGKRG